MALAIAQVNLEVKAHYTWESLGESDEFSGRSGIVSIEVDGFFLISGLMRGGLWPDSGGRGGGGGGGGGGIGGKLLDASTVMYSSCEDTITQIFCKAFANLDTQLGVIMSIYLFQKTGIESNVKKYAVTKLNSILKMWRGSLSEFMSPFISTGLTVILMQSLITCYIT